MNIGNVHVNVEIVSFENFVNYVHELVWMSHLVDISTCSAVTDYLKNITNFIDEVLFIFA